MFFKLLTFHSNPATAMPPAAPVPARPINRPEPSELAKRDEPICEQEGLKKKKSRLLNNITMFCYHTLISVKCKCCCGL